MTPPSTHRGVTETLPPSFPPAEAGLDWLQYSVPWPRDVREWPREESEVRELIGRALPPCDALELSGEILRPLHGYNAGMGLSFGRVFWHSDNRRQHIGVLFTGDDMRTAISVMLPHQQMLSWVLARARKIARLDFALDVHDPRAEPRDLLHLWKRGYVGTHAHVVQERVTWSATRERGLVSAPTVYFGRGDSERMLRVYDKAAQMGETGHWVRVELQTRHDQSMAMARAMQSAGIPAAGRQAIRSFVSCPKLEWYSMALVGPVVGMAPVGRRETNSDRWLRVVALPALMRATADYAEGGDWSLYDTIDREMRLISKSIERGKHLGRQE
jgi:hypothetical protein